MASGQFASKWFLLGTYHGKGIGFALVGEVFRLAKGGRDRQKRNPLSTTRTRAEKHMDLYTNSEDPFLKIVGISEDAIAFWNPSSDDVDAVVEAIRKDESVPKPKTVIALPLVKKVKYDEKRLALRFEVKDGTSTKIVSMDFKEQGERLSCFETLRRRLPDFSVKRTAFSPLRALVGPIVGMGVVGLVMWGVRGAAANMAAEGVPDVSGRHGTVKRLMIWLVDTLGPNGVLVVGGLIMLGTAFFAVSRVKKPPVWVELSAD